MIYYNNRRLQLMIIRIVLYLIFASIISNASAEPYFGKFVGVVSGDFISGTDPQLFKLDQPFTFVDPNGLNWTAPSGEVVDGASIPWWAWTIVGSPFTDNNIRASVIHDYYCCAKTRNYLDTHTAFWRALRLSGVGRPSYPHVARSAFRWTRPLGS